MITSQGDMNEKVSNKMPVFTIIMLRYSTFVESDVFFMKEYLINILIFVGS